MKRRVSVSVPATSGNIGPGFDVLGLAIDVRNEVVAEFLPAGRSAEILVDGEGADAVPRDRSNIIFRGVERAFRAAGRRVPPLRLRCRNRIPLARGMGSSAAAYLSGLLAGNALLGDRFGRDRLLAWASAEDGHPDNAAPALFGGVRASAVLDGEVVSVPWPVPRLRLVLAIPDFELATKKARAVLPGRIPMKDAVANLSAVALLPWFLSKRPEDLKKILNDRWHEPYRARLIPGFHAVKGAALRAGACGMTLSGAGPTLLAFAAPRAAARVAKAMEKAFRSANVKCRTLVRNIDVKGAIVR